MSYGGLGEGAWGRLLRSTSLPTRLFALRALSSMGQEGARILLEQPLNKAAEILPKSELRAAAWEALQCFAPPISPP